jgi:hypothetical protein
MARWWGIVDGIGLEMPLSSRGLRERELRA